MAPSRKKRQQTLRYPQPQNPTTNATDDDNEKEKEKMISTADVGASLHSTKRIKRNDEKPNSTVSDSNHCTPTVDNNVIYALDQNRIKNYMYKQQANMAILKPPALQLISTTTALFLKSLVERALPTISHTDDTVADADAKECSASKLPSSTKRKIVIVSSSSEKEEPQSKSTTLLITLDMLQQVVMTQNNNDSDGEEDDHEDDHDVFHFLQKPLTSISERSAGRRLAYVPSSMSTTTSKTSHNGKTTRATSISATTSNLKMLDKTMMKGDDVTAEHIITTAADVAKSSTIWKIPPPETTIIQEDMDDYD